MKNSPIPHIPYTSLSNLIAISSGLTSTIYLGQDPYNNNYILKLFNSNNFENYMKEITFISSYKNIFPNTIIPIYSYGVITDESHIWYKKYYIIMEYSPLGDLVNLIEASNINELNIKDIFKQLLISVNHFHQIGFIHRDIKPENFLLFENGMIKLIDFGFCERKDKLTKVNMGTPGYIAPEILLINEYDNCREELNGEAIDVFSLGVIAFVLVTREFPFENANDKDECYKYIYNNEWDKFWECVNKESLCKEFKDMFKKMVCVDKNERWSIQQILECDWIKNE